MDSYTSFDRLVSRLSSSERTALLEKLQTKVDPESQSLVSVEVSGGGSYKDIELQYKSESIFVRIWLFLKSIFSNTDVKVLYNAQLVSGRAKYVEKNYPNLIDSYKRVFVQGFYERLEELASCADFFKDGISAYLSDSGEFYVFLSSLIAPEIARQISQEVNPSNLPFDREVTNELRVSLVRKMENIIQSLPAVKRAALYNAVCCVDWLRYFVQLPFARILNSFSDENGRKVCSFEAVKNDISILAKVLCNGKCIESEVLEALFVFSGNRDSETKENYSEQFEKYIETASSRISMIKMFITTVPLRSIGAVVNMDAFWLPDRPEGSEDWFVKYKNTWRKAFDKQWEQWLSDRKKDVILSSMTKTFGFKNIPLLPNRPWAKIFGGVHFAYDYSMGFIYEFYKSVYPEYRRILKVLMLEGVFYLKDNLVELTDSCAEMDHQEELLNKLIIRLEEDGETGLLFEKLKYDNLHTPRGKARLDSLVKSLETESAVILGQWCGSARSIQMILNGVISGVRNNRYDTISNLASIQGKNNSDFRKKMIEVQSGFITALEAIKELETLK